MTAARSQNTVPWDGYAASLIEVDWYRRPLVIVPNGACRTVPATLITPFAVISACNPESRRRTTQVNEEATRRLRRRLIAMGVRHARAVGYSTCREWVEPSFALMDADVRVAEALCREFGQVAYFAVGPGSVQVVNDAGVTRSSRRAEIRSVAPGASVLAGLRTWFDH